MKKIIAVFLSLCMVCFLCGCSEIAEYVKENENKNKNEEITYESAKPGILKVHFIDVGQGDSEFIEFPDGKTMLIDAGESDYGKTVSDYIKSLGYTKIDYVVATHPHSDHIGGMRKILNTYPVGNFYMPDAVSSSNTFINMLEAVEKNECEAEYIESQKTIISNDEYGFSVHAVGPAKTYEDLNNSSAVLRLCYKNSSFLFTGDAEYDAENDIIRSGENISADVLKVGHHGSSTSSSARFLKAVNPTYGVISSGVDNEYGHPHDEVMDALKRRNVEIHRTDFEGTVIFETDGENYKIISLGKEKEEYKVDNPSSDVPVYRTKSGECYHIEGCDGLKRTKIPTTLEEATELGLRPCPNCRPLG